ncbi:MULTISPECIES: NAD(P)-binding domain-containing protein [unclassified Bradyrhizobium]|uniref:NAD(P)-binding domain-containing protein n=1 Tax=unclassified Bradyrhizobium TaxID=2631580 RepID=UPI001FFA275F|nr:MULTISPECIES: NAD(P)-binding domain-containing protein [unclassified Bradyrhizobium]MCK1708101.1 NAD(P)-binding domain-containing protein [Bradyrhizobium sp. 143]MCK1726785.1 NAD(P)-binding domain-containing protein [Bradyrhizobium sp. 142]
MADEKTVAIIGAGPVGLAAAAHVLERGMSPIVLEAGPEAGHAVRQWQHVQLFSPWEYNVDKAAARLLAPTGWNSPDPQSYPTGGELLERYLTPLATRTPLRETIRTSSRVTAISRVGFDKAKTKGREQALFEIRYQNGKGPEVLRADAVIDVSGTWFSPNPAGGNGLPAIGEQERADRVAYGMPDVRGADRARYAGKIVAVLGAGHSAVGTLIELVHLADEVPGTQPIWLLRGADPVKAFGGGRNDKLAARGELGSAFAALVAAGKIRVETKFAVSLLSQSEGRLRLAAGSCCGARSVIVDELIVATGFRPDFSFLSELRLRLDPAIDAPVALAPLIDPNEHSCGTVRPHGARELAHDEPGFYLAGMKSYGRAPTFLMITGYEQVRSIAADIAGDKLAAARVELVLPETGVCTRGGVEFAVASGCCGGSAKEEASACCAADETAKASGASGCGCS